MRYLHPVSHQEKFVASGVYVTTNLGDESIEKTSITEAWSIHLQSQGSRFIRIDRTATPTQEHLLSEVLQSPEGIIERVDLVWFRQAVTRRASFTMFDTYVQIGYKAEPGEREYLEFEIPAGTRLLPPFLLFTLGAVNRPDAGEKRWLVIDLTTPISPPPTGLEHLSWQAGEMQTLDIGRRQIETQVFSRTSNAGVLKVWQDRRLYIPVRITEQVGKFVKTSELRSIAY